MDEGETNDARAASTSLPELGVSEERRELIEFLFTYQKPTAVEVAAMQEIRTTAKALAWMLEVHVPPSADRTDAMRKLQECVNTANRGITLLGRSYR